MTIAVMLRGDVVIYVMSDIHGSINRYRDIMRQIRLKKVDHLYVLGDVIDRGKYGLPILADLMRRPNVTVLLGNHEHMMLEAINKNDPDCLYLWHMNGGYVTHARYKRCTKEYRQRVLDYIQRMPVNIEVCCQGTNYLLVHGGPLKQNKSFPDPVAESVWNRLEYDAVVPKGKIVIFGHTPTRHYQSGRPLSVFFGKDKIGIDCGCAYSDIYGGRLACLRLDDMKVFYSSVPEQF